MRAVSILFLIHDLPEDPQSNLWLFTQAAITANIQVAWGVIDSLELSGRGSCKRQYLNEQLFINELRALAPSFVIRFRNHLGIISRTPVDLFGQDPTPPSVTPV